MATKKKELLEQENSAPETTVPVENTPPTDEAQADSQPPGGHDAQAPDLLFRFGPGWDVPRL